MQHELNALKSNHTWQLTSLPVGKKAIGCKWVYNLKSHLHEPINKHKACLVAKGFNQVTREEFSNSLSLIAKLATVKLLLAMIASKGWLAHHLNMINDFLHDFVDEDVYMKSPKGYVIAEPGQVCKLKRPPYGLKQTGR